MSIPIIAVEQEKKATASLSLAYAPPPPTYMLIQKNKEIRKAKTQEKKMEWRRYLFFLYPRNGILL